MKIILTKMQEPQWLHLNGPKTSSAALKTTDMAAFMAMRSKQAHNKEIEHFSSDQTPSGLKEK